ncbi:MAG: STT3 domain-containing protein [Acidilobaceae archaeon]
MRERRRWSNLLIEALREKWSLVCVLLLVLVLATGTYLRLLPAVKYGLELDEADPFIMYYIAKHFYERGLFSFSELQDQDLFWHPLGRDLLRREYIGVGWLSAATYHIVSLVSELTLREWVALQPVIAYVLTCILAYLLVYRVTGSHSGALVAAALYSLLPSALSRTTVGFVEKMTIAFLPITLHYILFYEALSSKSSSRSLTLAVLAGAVGGFVAFIWGGYHFIALSLALAILLDFLVYGSASRERALVYAVTLTAMAVVVSASPAVSILYFAKGMGFIPLAALIAYIAILAWKSLGFDEKLFPYTRLQHLWLIASGAVVGFVLIHLEVISVPGRVLLALGVRGFSPLAESVSEHQPLGLGALIPELGVPVFFTLTGLVFSALESYRGRGNLSIHVALTLGSMALLMAYASYNMAYFLQIAVLYTTIASGVSLGLVSKAYLALSPREVSGKREKARTREYSGASVLSPEVRIVFTVSIIALLLVFLGYSVHASYEVNSLRAPQILTAGLGPLAIGGETVVPLNNAWIRALEYLKHNTSREDVIVSWWDYGYWISVDAGRRTIADGSTWNETHIRLLARILTSSSEAEAIALLKLLGLNPNQTYIVFYEVFVLHSIREDPVLYVFPMPSIQTIGNTYYVVHGLADFPKSFQMLRIAHRVDPSAPSFLDTDYYSVTRGVNRVAYMFPGFAGSPSSNVEKVKSTLIYRLATHGVLELSRKCLGSCGFLANTSLTLPAVFDPATGALQFIFAEPPESFVLEAVVVDVFHEVSRRDSVERYAVLVFIYKWVDR